MVYKSIDLFAGIGGIRLGFDRAFKDEIETVFVSEWDEKAQETYGSAYSDIAFHKALLSIGPAPFDIVKKYLKDYYRQTI